LDEPFDLAQEFGDAGELDLGRKREGDGEIRNPRAAR